MSLLPKEHGAYGQMSLPLLTAFLVAGPSAAGLLIAAAVIAGFLAHEPAAVLLGLRGPRAKRELRGAALRLLGICLVLGTGAGVAALMILSPHARPSLVLPIAPALLLLAATMRGTEKAWPAQVAAALAFSGAAVPIVMAAGAPLLTGLAVMIPFALLFVTSTLAVRVVILRVRGGGDPRAAASTRVAALVLGAAATVALAVASAASLLPISVLLASAPGLLTAAIVALHPPAPAHLHRLGWTLVAVSILTGLLVLAANAWTFQA